MLARRALLLLKFVIRTALILEFLPSPALPADTQDRQAEAGSCQLESGGESTVLAIGDPLTLHLADGRRVCLAEIFTPINAKGAGFAASSSATDYLRTNVLGRKVEVRFGGKHQDRYGATIAHIFVAGDHPLWVQEGLVSAGLAEAFPQPDNHACSKQLLSLEGKARDEARGYWGLALFKVLNARETRPILNFVQTYQIIEGEVTFVTHTTGRAIFHFAKDSQFSFTATVESAAQKKLSEQRLDDWQGQKVRVRGWIERKKGPTIAVVQPEQIELLRQQPTEPNPADPQ